MLTWMGVWASDVGGVSVEMVNIQCLFTRLSRNGCTCPWLGYYVKYGAFRSVLYDLPYYDPIRMLVIDPMHNLFLGSAKRFIATLHSDKTVKMNTMLDQMQRCMDEFEVPPDMSRIPRKIASKWADLTAAEWMHWTLYFSRIVFRRMDLDKYVQSCEQIWNYFVEACRLMCGRYIRRSDINTINDYLFTFCHGVERIFGEARCTMNMHLHCHLKEVMLDYGPVCAYWTFPFERYNGYLASMPRNGINIEPQIMRRIIQETQLSNQIASITKWYTDSDPVIRLGHRSFSNMNESDIPTEATGAQRRDMEWMGSLFNYELPTHGLHRDMNRLQSLLSYLELSSKERNESAYNLVYGHEGTGQDETKLVLLRPVRPQAPSLLPDEHHSMLVNTYQWFGYHKHYPQVQSEQLFTKQSVQRSARYVGRSNGR